MIAIFSFIFALLFLIYSVCVIILAPVEIMTTTDYKIIKTAKRFLYSLFCTIPLCIFCFIIFCKSLKSLELLNEQNYDIRLKNIPASYAPKIIISDKDTGDIIEEIEI